MTDLEQERSQLAAGIPASELIVGPTEQCAEWVWQLLSDFESWPEWLRDYRQVRQLDSGAPGRGSRLQVSGPVGVQIWEIIHWDPPRRLDLEIDVNSVRAGYCLTVNPHEDSRFAQISLQMEFINNHPVTLRNAYTRRKLRKQGLLFMQEFSAFIQAKLKNPRA